MRATGKSREEVFGALTTLPRPPNLRRSAAMAKMKAGDDDNDTSNDELIARAIEEALENDADAAAAARADAEAKDAAVLSEMQAADPWRQAEFEWDTVESRELKEGPAKGKVGLKR